ncbi:MAG: carbon starvation protein A [Eggerthellaceae bacterium]|nr:carbon starvation protein A [Eggerthellaceae bacterium]
MNAMILLIIAAVVLVCGYLFYGKWLAKSWGIDPSKPTPSHEMADGVDYVAAPPYVVLGHHFSSIAGAGPINGPIQAAIFGWVPVTLWVLIGGIFFGAMHDMGALFSSVRHKGQTLAIVVRDNMDNTAKTLFTIFAYLTLVLVVAAFASIVAGTFGVSADYNPGAVSEADDRNMTTASISIFFILAAVIWGLALRGRKIPGAANIALAIVVLVICVAAGILFHPLALSSGQWMWILAVYILVASLAPVWILLQPRDYLSSYLLYGMIILAVVGIIGAGLLGRGQFDVPAYTGLDATVTKAESGSVVATTGYLFPALFITIACGAISGFHSLVASGTTSKQIDNEAHIQPIGYGGMLIECLLAIISLCAVGFVWNSYITGADYTAPTQIFAGGLAGMLEQVFGSGVHGIAFQLLVLAVSAFCLTSLDTATRLARYMFQELWIPAGESLDTVTGWRKALSNPYVATIITVVFGIGLGMTGYSIIWPLFGAANQLLAALALLAVATWLKNAGRKNGMFYIPMVFMLIVTLTSLFFTIQQKINLFTSGGASAVNPDTGAFVQAGGPAGVAAQLIIACILFVLAIVLAVKGGKTLFGSSSNTANKQAA